MDPTKHVKRMTTSAALIAVVIFAALVIYSGIYTVTETERAVVTTFGRQTGVAQPGLNFRVPVFQQVYIINTMVRGMEFGYETVRGVVIPNESESFMITEDFNFVNVDFAVQWQVIDPVKYRFASEDPETLLRNILQAEARSVVAAYSVDLVLTTAKTEIQIQIHEAVRRKLEVYDVGIMVTQIIMQDATPPTQAVIDAFKNVENARQYLETQINNARAYYNRVIPAAEAIADGIVQEAQAEKQSRIHDAEGQTARFNSMFEEYILHPEITRTRMYLETMEHTLPNTTLFVDGGGEILRLLNINPQNEPAREER